MGRTDSTKIPPDFPEGTSFMQWLKGGGASEFDFFRIYDF